MGDADELADYKLYENGHYLCTGSLKKLSKITGKDKLLLKFYADLNRRGKETGNLKLVKKQKEVKMENLILNKVKKWFIDRDLENGGRLDKQSLKLSEEFGELCAGFLKKNEALTKDSIGDCAVVVVGLVLLIKEDVHGIFEEANNIRRKEAMDCFKLLNANISEFQLSQDLASKKMCRHNLVRIVAYLKSISNILGYEFLECFTGAYNEIKDRKGKWIDGSFVKEEDLPDE